MCSLPRGHVHRYAMAMSNPAAVSLAKWGAGGLVQFKWLGHPSHGRRGRNTGHVCWYTQGVPGKMIAKGPPGLTGWDSYSGGEKSATIETRPSPPIRSKIGWSRRLPKNLKEWLYKADYLLSDTG
jgi:hypothetical protein